MIARFQQPPPSEPTISLTDPAMGISARRAGVLFGVLGFLCFMPYIAIPVGKSTAVQLGSVLSALMLTPFFLKPKLWRSLWIYPVLIAPLLLSMLKVGMSADGDVVLSFRTNLVWIVSLLTMTASQIYAPRYTLELLTGIAVATIIHVLLGFYQLYCFQSGEFPFAWMYVNPSFYSVTENVEIIGKYIQRPFGYFPEPSAMSSSLGPFLLFWAAELFGLVRLKREPAPWQRFLFAGALIGGIGLVVVSRSGHGAIVIASIMLFVAIWFIRCKATPKSFLAILLVFVVAMPMVLYFAAESLGDRVDGKTDVGNSSWEDRSNSLIFGYKLLVEGDLPTVIFGCGVGQTSPILDRLHGLEAVWSVSLSYLYETGLVGVAACCVVGAYLYRMWRKSRFNLPYVVIFAGWLVGVTLTTSYTELLTLWIALGWLLEWPEFCEAPANAAISTQRAPAKGWKPKTTGILAGGKPKWSPLGWREPVVVPINGGSSPAMHVDPSALSVSKQPRRWSEL